MITYDEQIKSEAIFFCIFGLIIESIFWLDNDQVLWCIWLSHHPTAFSSCVKSHMQWVKRAPRESRNIVSVIWDSVVFRWPIVTAIKLQKAIFFWLKENLPLASERSVYPSTAWGRSDSGYRDDVFWWGKKHEMIHKIDLWCILNFRVVDGFDINSFANFFGQMVTISEILSATFLWEGQFIKLNLDQRWKCKKKRFTKEFFQRCSRQVFFCILMCPPFVSGPPFLWARFFLRGCKTIGFPHWTGLELHPGAYAGQGVVRVKTF